MRKTKREHLSNFEGDKRQTKFKSEFGWWILMTGILLEIITGYSLAVRDAINEVKNNPWNGMILDVSGRAFFEVRRDDVPDMAIWGTTQQVSRLILCENIEQAENGISGFGFFCLDQISSRGMVLF
jgi:hypothetical protein